MNNHNSVLCEASSSQVPTAILKVLTPEEINMMTPPAPILEFGKNCSTNKEIRIMLTWRFAQGTPENIMGYQLFVGQIERGGVTGSVHWRKVGDIPALPLPAVCVLNNFVKYGVYCFKLRAINIRKIEGTFSYPVYIRKIHPDPSLPLNYLHPDVRAGVIEIRKDEQNMLSYSDCLNLYNKNLYLNEATSRKVAAPLKRVAQEAQSPNSSKLGRIFPRPPLPPAPELRFGKAISKGGKLTIILVWSFAEGTPQNIIAYDLFSQNLGTCEWMKFRNIRAVQSPVCCFITNFRPGIFCFGVRSVDSDNRRGCFSTCVFVKVWQPDPSLPRLVAVPNVKQPGKNFTIAISSLTEQP